MSQFTPEQIIEMIEKAGGPEKLDLHGQDLSEIDLSRDRVQELLSHLPPGSKPVWFSQETGSINLQGADLGEANLQGAELGGANLKGTEPGGANLKDAELGDANLKDAELFGANLQRAYLGDANLQAADLGWANLQGARLDQANLQDAQLGWADLERANLTRARLEGAYFYGARLNLTRLELPQVIGEEKDGRWEQARHAYIALKVNLRNLGYYEQAREAFKREMRMKRHTLFPTEAGNGAIERAVKALPEPHWKQKLGRLYRGWLYAKLWLGFKVGEGKIRQNRPSYLGNLALDKLFYYFESPGRVLLYLLIAPLLFGLLYLGLNFMGWGGAERVLADATRQPASLGEVFIFSLRTLPTLAYGDLVPVGAGRWLSAFEGMLGVGLFALLVYTLGRRVSGY